MSIEEGNAAIGALVKERAECRRKVALLVNELETAGKHLYEVGEALRYLPVNGKQSAMHHILPLLESCPEVVVSKITARFVAYLEAANDLVVLNTRASEVEID